MNHEEDSENQVPPSAFEKFLRRPWWGWTILSFGGAIFGMGLSSLISALGWPIHRLSEGLNMLLMVPLFFCGSMALFSLLVWRFATRAATLRWLTYGGLLFVGGISLELVSIVFLSFHAMEQSREIQREHQWVDQTVPGGWFQISAPASWTRPADSLFPGCLHLTTVPQDLHLVAYTVSHADVTSATLEEFQQTYVQQIAESLGSPTIQTSQVRSVGPLKVIDSTVIGSIEHDMVRFQIRHFDDGRNWGEVRFFASPSRMDAHQETIDRILESVRPVNENEIHPRP